MKIIIVDMVQAKKTHNKSQAYDHNYKLCSEFNGLTV